MQFIENNLTLFTIIIVTICFISTFTTIVILLFPKKGLLIRRLPLFFKSLHASKALNLQNMQKDLDPLLEEKITDLLKTVTAQIPMGSMLLSSSLGKNLREKTKAAIVEMLPELKEKILMKGELLLEQKWEEEGGKMILRYGIAVALFSASLALSYFGIGMALIFWMN